MNRNVVVLTISGLSMLLLAGVVNKKIPRPSVAQMNNYRSNGFTSRTEKDEFAAPQPGEYQTVTTPFAFEIAAPTTQEGLLVRFKYTCDGSCPQLWLTMATKPQTPPIRILVHHPAIENRPMPSISNGILTLFQKKITHPTIESFIKDPPPSEKTIVVDEAVAAYLPQSFIEASYTENTTITSPDYWLTSYIRPRIFYHWYEFSRVFHTKNAALNAANHLEFFLETIPTNSTLKVSPPTVSVYRE